jgi:cell division protein FtsB
VTRPHGDRTLSLLWRNKELQRENDDLRAENERLSQKVSDLLGQLVRAVDTSSRNMLLAALSGAFERKAEAGGEEDSR